MMYGSWDMEWDRQNVLSFWAIFCPFTTPLMIPNIKTLKKNEKKCLEILSFYTYMCTINEDHMIYGSWNIRCDRQKFSTFWAIFCPFSPLTTWKIQTLTLKKTLGDIIILHICMINDNHMIYGSWDMEPDRHNFWSFWTVFCPFPPYGPRKSKFSKNAKNIWRYYHFTNTNGSHMMYGSSDMEHVTDRIFCHFWRLFSLLQP